MYTKLLSELNSRLATRNGSGIARALGSMVSDGHLSPGDKLPPIRSVASSLGVSSSTVADAWSIMRAHRMIETDRRRGTTIRASPRTTRKRYWRVPTEPGTLSLDLSTGTPDPLLLPAIEPILERIHSNLETTSYLDPPVLPALGDELRKRWPFEPQSLAVLDGANDCLDRVIRATIKLGDTVIVEDPTYPLLLDLLELAGAEIIGVPVDQDGPLLADLTAAMERQPVALIIQTGAHNPTGISLTQDRADAISSLVSGTKTLVIEDEHAGATSATDAVSLGSTIADQVVRIHSFSKTYGPDLRIAALSGPTELIQEVNQRRQLGPGWTSRLIQRVLLEMLLSSDVDAQIIAAATEYQRRRDDLADALRSLGLDMAPGRGLNMWVSVEREDLAAIGLAARGIGVAPGEPFRVNSADLTSDHLRITSAHVRSDIEAVADAIASVASATGTR